MSPDKEPNPQRATEMSPPLRVSAVVLGVVIAAGGGYYLADKLDHGEKKPDVVSPLEATVVPEVQTLSVVDLYRQNKSIDEDYNQRRRSGESADKIRKDLARLTLSKIDAINGVNKDFSSVRVIDKPGWVISVKDKKFDLDDEEGLFVGSSLVEHLFREEFRQDLQDELGFPFDEQDGSDRVVDNVLWLADHVDLKIGDIGPLAHIESLEKLSQGLQALEKAGLAVPNKATIQGFQYDDENLYKSADFDTILVRVNSYNGDFAAQASVGDYVVANDSQFLDMYSKNLSTISGGWGDRVTEERLISPSSYADVYPDWLRLGTSVQEYIFNGVGFRKKLAYAEATGHQAEAQFLWVEYQMLKQKFGDTEFTVDGQPKEVQEYKLGDVLKIDDYEGYERQGIFLRETPTLEIDPNRSSIGNGSKVKILEGPVVILDDVRAQGTKMWKVGVGNVSGGRIFVGYDRESGWVSEEWFGNKIELQ